MKVLSLGGYENLTVSLSKLNCSIFYSMRQLDLSTTSFSAALPDSIGCIRSLNYLHLGTCQISGVVPKSIGNLTQLTELSLEDNYLLGEIPDKFSSSQKLSRLSLGHNLLAGKFLNSLLNFTHLGFLDLSSNQLSGSISPSIFTIPTLSYLDLSSNHFAGVGQDVFVDFNKLQKNPLQNEAPWNTTNNVSISYPDFWHLGLSSCQIKEFPELLRNSKSLKFLDLSNNRIHGKIPSWFMSKTWDNLLYLNLSHNFLTGTIDQLRCKYLLYLDMSFNSLQGQMPSSICSHNRFHGATGNFQTESPFPQLRIIDASCNELIGVLPTELFKSLEAMRSLRDHRGEYMSETGYELDYYIHSLTLVIKGTEYSLERVLIDRTAIDFSNSRFEGRIPEIIGTLHSLLIQNHLIGLIPRGRHFDTFGNDSYRGNLALCGSPLTKDCGNTGAPPPASPFGSEQQYDPEFFDGFAWRAVVLGYGCGLVLGLAMGSLMFLTEKPRWFIQIVEVIQTAKKIEERNMSTYELENSNAIYKIGGQNILFPAAVV
ncbi:receptor-like protein Cf-9 homolog [Coffea eugenioides]|uniref:receptor-like protein Cf-9 homolog n=1 Tax=Coffea eugenioides TaxID=49369 RepID=UPI000F61541D|nr:receptor-like protein Cf-9 homolog [Coffea eugenioides]